MPDKLNRKEIPLTGKLITNEDPAIIGVNFRQLTNMRYTRTNPKGIGGYSKINSTALAYPKVRSGIHFRKEQPSESHLVVEAYNSGETASEIYQNTTAIPDTGDFSASIYTPSTSAGRGRWSLAPDGYIAYANGEETCVWGGNESQVGGFINYDPSDDFFRDYTDQVSTTKSTGAENIATLERVAEITTNNILLLHLENNDTDSSTSAHTLTNPNVSYTSGAKKWGSYGAELNGSNANFVVPSHADFDFSGVAATWGIDYWGIVDDLDNNHYFYYKATDANNYFTCFITTGGAIQVSHFDTSAETLNSTNGFFTGDAVITAGVQYHIEISRNGSSWYIFVDGKLKQTMTDATNTGTETGDVLIGTNGTAYYDGKIDEYRISNAAIHTSDFEIPIAAYGDRNVTYLYVGSIMPLEGIKFYVETANTSSATASINYWDGDSWEAVGNFSDGTSSGGKSLAQTGTMGFDSTAGTAKVKDIKGVLTYWYRISIPSMDDNVVVYYVTVKTPFQEIKDGWDGIPLSIPSFFKYKTSYSEETLRVREADYLELDNSTRSQLHGITTSGFLLCGFEQRMSGVRFLVIGDRGNTATNCVCTVEYWDGDDWVSVGVITDGTSNNNISLAQSGLITWDAIADGVEFKREITGGGTESPTLFYYKLSFSKTLDGDTDNDLYVDQITGVPAQATISAYKFPLYAMDRLWLFSDQKGNKNESLCSSESTVNVLSGDEAIPLFWGDESEIIGAEWLYSQLEL